jgi:putative toxin-antitoxin system antitoxin component (TIGR02293 family)
VGRSFQRKKVTGRCAWRVFAKATDTFGASDKASRWLQKPNRALDGNVPLDLLDTDAGTQEVQTILIRIDYGLYS